MILKENIYQSLPSVFQNIALSYVSRRIASRRFSVKFYKKLAEISGRDRMNPETLLHFQIRALRSNMVTAYENTVFYRRLFDQYGIDPHRFNNPEQINSLPVLTKTIIKEHFKEIVNQNYKGKSIILRTSGTTGSGFVFPETIPAEHQHWATCWRFRRNIGLDTTSWYSLFGGRTIIPVRHDEPPFWKIIPGLNQVSYSMYHLNPLTVADYVKDMNERKISWIHGYPSTLAYLALLMKERGLCLNFKVEQVTTASENLLAHQRSIIGELFGTEPFQHYALSEPVANISECEYRKLHIDEDYAFVELIPVEGGNGACKVIGTSFTNDVLFFLRYDTGDIVTPAADQHCPCGRTGRIIEHIDGRKEDYILLRNGTRLGRLDHILKNMTNILEAQIVQEQTGELIFNIVKNDQYGPEDAERLNNEITARIDQDYRVVYTDSIEKTAAGKLRFVIRK